MPQIDVVDNGLPLCEFPKTFNQDRILTCTKGSLPDVIYWKNRRGDLRFFKALPQIIIGMLTASIPTEYYGCSFVVVGFDLVTLAWRIGARSALAYMYVCIYCKQLRKLAGELLANERLASRGICPDADIMTAN